MSKLRRLFLLALILGVCSLTLNVEKPIEAQSEFLTVNASTLNVRSGPSTDHSIVTVVHNGDILSLIKRDTSWSYVQLLNGKKGWVSNVYLKEMTPLLDGKAQASTSPAIPHDSLSGKTIIIDPGHGGDDRGTTGKFGTYEKTLNLNTALLLKQTLESHGAHVILTRTSDKTVTLKERVALANRNEADLFVSLHYNSHKNPSINGLITYYYESPSAAHTIHKGIVKNSPLKDGKTRFGDYFVLRENEHPSILLELGFLSNGKEEETITSSDFQRKMASSISEGLAAYFY
ncbi:N-acetylmuramoyl-L-alanine amidase [Priestia endophytica]|uniref:N-acetylmuramoyl-L-alanine amidase n=1 Tax=Priestia endophytica DSM 13796 TaxID=1121089 RepID=A0A1I5WLT6_9BACI|nr:N-acetylmuramoyl-L-alanine amidase [Priestia endophytica]KAB2495614.1 N-acetylmuramoyl-L-alanine amidase [Priestia endophytica]RAS82345.1 hypothetical protein A4R27_09140 [Priestia endophytica]RAS88841.1 hypothetical protein A4U60_03285 [Priestia endophytica]SFQ20346.1 N-acetylmuramoyl-L-alanine amidase [Priestia endophytica DSM 13796]